AVRNACKAKQRVNNHQRGAVLQHRFAELRQPVERSTRDIDVYRVRRRRPEHPEVSPYFRTLLLEPEIKDWPLFGRKLKPRFATRAGDGQAARGCGLASLRFANEH